MESVIISINPKWCSLISEGNKTIEVRKSRPNIETPFKCYVYCTQNHDVHDLLEIHSGGKILKANGKVFGEFVCDHIHKLIPCSSADFGVIDYIPISNAGLKNACLTRDDLIKYGKGKNLYCWQISNFTLYDKPKEIKDFIRPCKNDLYCEVCAMYSEFEDKCRNKALQLSRPPQSWCYVEELEG